jgi:hypothetical protein
MTDSGLIPIRFYGEFTKRDWPELPEAAQDALASFLLKLQKNPENPEKAIHAQRDALGSFGYEFSPGYRVYWRVVRNEFGESLQAVRIEVLAIVKTEIGVLETGKKNASGENSSTSEERDSIERVYSRTAALGNLAMWGTLHKSRRTGKIKGWVVDSWSQGGPPYLKPKMHWVSFPDYRLYHMQLKVDYNSTMQIGEEDAEIEPERLIFIHATLKQWEQDWLENEMQQQGK